MESMDTSNAGDDRVQFGQVRVHTHGVTLGANPSVSSGPPIALNWNVERSDHFTLDEYESQKSSEDGKSLSRLSGQDREAWLRNNGHTQQSFDRIDEEIQDIKRGRLLARAEAAMSELSPMEEYQLMANASSRDVRRSLRLQKKEQAPPSSCGKAVPHRKRSATKRSFLGYFGGKKGKSRSQPEEQNSSRLEI